MFTGIVEEVGTVTGIVKGLKSAVITITAKKIFDDLKQGDSVATNGVCLTVVSLTKESFTADVMNQTLKNSSIGKLKIGMKVNLERAMMANGRFGGHIVSGHIDGTGTITNIQKEDIAILYTIKTSDFIMRYIVEKGSIAIDGLSLTVSKVDVDKFSVSIIPHTAKETTISQRNIGDTVNLENDVVGKYIDKFLSKHQGITKEFLSINGF